MSIDEGKQTLLKLFSSSYQYMTKTVLASPNTVNDIARKLPALHKDLVAQGKFLPAIPTYDIGCCCIVIIVSYRVNLGISVYLTVVYFRIAS